MTERVSSSAHWGHWLGCDGKKINFFTDPLPRRCVTVRNTSRLVCIRANRCKGNIRQLRQLNISLLNTRLNTTSSSQLNISLLQSKILQQRKVNGNCSNHNAGHPNLVLRLNAVPSIGFRLPATRRKVEQTRRPTQCGVGASRLGAVITRSGREP